MQNPFAKNIKATKTVQTALTIPTREPKKKSKGLFEEQIEGPLIGLKMPTDFKVLEKYPLLPPFAYAVIAEDPQKRIPRYFVEELPLTLEETDLYTKVISALEIEVEAPKAGEDQRKYFSEQALRTANRYRLAKKSKTPVSWAKLLYYAERDMVGFGGLDPMMRDPNIEDITLDSATRPVFIYHRKYENLETNLVFEKNQKLDDTVVRLVHVSGKHVSTAFPIVDATLPGKHRLTVTFRTEVTPLGSSFTIRKFRSDPMTFVDLIKSGMIDYLAGAYSWLLIENRAAALVVGATASGKTTFLNSLLSTINPTSKLVTIEEVQEINVHHTNWTPMISRLSYGLTETSVGEISLFGLVKTAMRMRPDVLVVGEVRGEEAYALFQALSTGHGGLATIHGDDTTSAFQRLVSKPMDVAAAFIPFLDFVYTVRRVLIPNPANPDMPKIARRLISIDEIVDVNNFVRTFTWNPAVDRFDHFLENSVKLKQLAQDRGKSMDQILEEIRNRSRVLEYLASKNMRNFVDIATVLSQYHNDPRNVLGKINANGSAPGS